MVARVPRRERRPLTPERQALAARYLPLARSLARRFKDSFPDSRDEFESDACLALTEAAEAFDPGRKVKFPTFARYRISGALRDTLRRRILHGYEGTPEEAPDLMTLHRHAEEYGRVLAAELDPPVGEDTDAIDSVERLIRTVPPKHAAALRRIYLHGDTHARAARALGCSPSRVAYMHREALAMLRGDWGA